MHVYKLGVCIDVEAGQSGAGLRGGGEKECWRVKGLGAAFWLSTLVFSPFLSLWAKRGRRRHRGREKQAVVHSDWVRLDYPIPYKKNP